MIVLLTCLLFSRVLEVLTSFHCGGSFSCYRLGIISFLLGIISTPIVVFKVHKLLLTFAYGLDIFFMRLCLLLDNSNMNFVLNGIMGHNLEVLLFVFGTICCCMN